MYKYEKASVVQKLKLFKNVHHIFHCVTLYRSYRQSLFFLTHLNASQFYSCEQTHCACVKCQKLVLPPVLYVKLVVFGFLSVNEKKQQSINVTTRNHLREHQTHMSCCSKPSSSWESPSLCFMVLWSEQPSRMDTADVLLEPVPPHASQRGWWSPTYLSNYVVANLPSVGQNHPTEKPHSTKTIRSRTTQYSSYTKSTRSSHTFIGILPSKLLSELENGQFEEIVKKLEPCLHLLYNHQQVMYLPSSPHLMEFLKRWLLYSRTAEKVTLLYWRWH